MGTPDATYEGMSEPKPLSMELTSELTSPARSLITPLFLYVLVGSQLAGEGVINGRSWPTWPGLGMLRRTAVAVTRGRSVRSTVGRVVRIMSAILNLRVGVGKLFARVNNPRLWHLLEIETKVKGIE